MANAPPAAPAIERELSAVLDLIEKEKMDGREYSHIHSMLQGAKQALEWTLGKHVAPSLAAETAEAYAAWLIGKKGAHD